MEHKHKSRAVAKVKNEFSDQIREFRKSLGLSQGEFAEEIGVQQPILSQWEKGSREPSADKYVKLALLSKTYSYFELFMSKAGIDWSKLSKRLSSEIGRIVRASSAPSNGLVTVPVLRDSVHVADPRLAPEHKIEYRIPLPAEMIPRPDKTSGIRASSNEMQPMFGVGDVVLIDSSEIDHYKLVGHLVAVAHRNKNVSSVTVRYLHLLRGKQENMWVLMKVHMDSLKPLSGSDVLFPQQDSSFVAVPVVDAFFNSSDFVIPIGRGSKLDSAWTLLGRVFMWLGTETGKKKKELKSK